MSGYRCEGGPLDGWRVENDKFINAPMHQGDERGTYVYSTLGVIKWRPSEVSIDHVHIRPDTTPVTTA